MTHALFASLRDAKTILLTTYKRDSTPVATPVSIAFDDGRAFFRTWHTAGKAKRLRNNPNVEVAPCDFSGKPQGPVCAARAQLLDGADEQRARTALAKRHPFLQRIAVPLAHKLMRWRTLHYELLANDE